MSSATATNQLVLELAGVLIVACFGFSADAVSWLGLGVGGATAVIALAGFTLRYRGVAQRWLDMATAIVGGWMIVATRAFPSQSARWLDFSAAVAVVALATIGIALADAIRTRLLREGAPLPWHHDANGHSTSGFVISEPEPLRRPEAVDMRFKGPLADSYPAAVVLVVVALVPYLGLTAALQPLTPVLSNSLHLSTQSLQLTTGMANAAYAIGTVLAAQFAVHLPPRRMLLLYALLFLAGSVLAAWAPRPGCSSPGTSCTA